MAGSICFSCASHLYIGGVPLTVSPRAGNSWEGAVRVVELVVIGTKEECGEGLLKRKQIWHRKDQRSPPKSKVIIILIIIFFTLLICISNATIIIKITKNIRTVWNNWITTLLIQMHVNSRNKLQYLIVIFFCDSLKESVIHWIQAWGGIN